MPSIAAMETGAHAFGPYHLVPGRELRRGGDVLSVGPKGLAVLEALLAAKGAVVTKAELMALVWPDVTVEEGNLTVQIAALRKELGPRPDGSDWVVTIPRIGYRFAAFEKNGVDAPSDAAPAGPPLIAVLPFLNLSGDPAKAYFAEGLVEELIAALSRFRSFAVVARNSSFTYRDRSVDVRQIARELGVRYVLEGSVRLAGERVRVTAQLVDAESGTHLWARNFDGDFSQIFEFQDHIGASVVGLVEPQIRQAEIARSRRRRPGNAEAYDLFLRALPAFFDRDPAQYREAITLLDEALALDPGYALAMAFASWAYVRWEVVGLEPLDASERARCLSLARAAIAAGTDDPEVLAIVGHSLVAVGQMHQEGLSLVRRAREANPNNVLVLNQAGICNMMAGDLDEAEACFARAYQLSPGSLGAYESIAGVGYSRYFKRDYEGAVEWLQRSRHTLVDWPPTYWLLASAFGQLGRLDDAGQTIARLLEIAPQTSLKGMDVVAPRFQSRWPHLREGLALAGLK
ncbi:MAG TPA: winged helix-turn-helix domain-containing protein [Devosia sp.]|nr:winged helix-turn-helix domain-containing protein [Devosia sp.]